MKIKTDRIEEWRRQYICRIQEITESQLEKIDAMNREAFIKISHARLVLERKANTIPQKNTKRLLKKIFGKEDK